jgi:hypothetical protein
MWSVLKGLGGFLSYFVLSEAVYWRGVGAQRVRSIIIGTVLMLMSFFLLSLVMVGLAVSLFLYVGDQGDFLRPAMWVTLALFAVSVAAFGAGWHMIRRRGRS